MVIHFCLDSCCKISVYDLALNLTEERRWDEPLASFETDQHTFVSSLDCAYDPKKDELIVIMYALPSPTTSLYVN
jgi:hypothetical protein